jgi:hypothetical protein
MNDDFMFTDEVDMGPQEAASGPDLRDLSAVAGISVPGMGSEEGMEPPVGRPPSPVATTTTPSEPTLFAALPAPAKGFSVPAALPLIGAVGAAAAGGMYAGAWGVAAGVTASGAIINILRYFTTKGSDPQAASAHMVFAVVSGAAAVYTGRKAYLERKERTTRTSPVRSNREMPKWLKPT